MCDIEWWMLCGWHATLRAMPALAYSVNDSGHDCRNDGGNDNGPAAGAAGPPFCAERVGFEPTDHFKGDPRISSAVPST